MWPKDAACAFLLVRKKLIDGSERGDTVDAIPTDLSRASADVASALRALGPALEARVDRARTDLATVTLLVDDEDRRFERHRRILESSLSRQLDLLAKLKGMTKTSAVAGSYERLPPVELRVIKG